MKNKYRIAIILFVGILVTFLVFRFSETEKTSNDLIFIEPRPEVTLDSLNSINLFSGDQSSELLTDFEKFKSKFDSIIYDEKAYYVVEGDLRFNEDELFAYYVKSDSIVKPLTPHQVNQVQLVIGLNEDDNLDIMPNARGLTYAIFKESFPLNYNYKKVKENFIKASDEWSEKLDSGVKFTHQENLDTIKDEVHLKSKVSFIVKYVNPKKDSKQLETAALAFFPSSDKAIWNVEIRPGYFATDYDKIGILRHEIGHILGFRHEHALDSSPDACKKSDKKVKPLSTYDRVSVMHYFCGGYGNKELTFTERDIEGAKCIYNINNIPCELDY